VSRSDPPRRRSDRSVRTVARVLLGVFLLAAGSAHLLVPEPFLAQTPTWLPAREFLILVSGLVELALGVALLLARRWRRPAGWATAAFFVLVVPGNVHQALSGADAFGLDTPTARWGRLAVQPVLIAWALWSTGALRRPGTSRPGRAPDLRP
jgi:uncharacterized membrane protein